MYIRYRSAALAIVLCACKAQKPNAEPAPAPPPPSICNAPRVTGRVPAVLHEASGLAASMTQRGILWTLNDDAPAAIFAIDSAGTLHGRVVISNASNRDWESLTTARCTMGSATTCLYIGDIGDNLRQHASVRVYRIPEPALDAKTVEADVFEFHYPDGPHDAEAMFVLPGEQLYVVTKGRHEPITVYRYPGALQAGTNPALQEVQRLTATFVQLPDMLTGAGNTPDGRWIVLRTYSTVQLYQLQGGLLSPQLPGRGIDLQNLREPQGEGVDIMEDGTIALVSEKGLDEGLAPVSRITCRLTS